MKLSEIIKEVNQENLQEIAPVLSAIGQGLATGAKVLGKGAMKAGKSVVKKVAQAGKEKAMEIATDVADAAKEKFAQSTVKPPTPPPEPITPPDLRGGQVSQDQAAKQKEAMGIKSQEEVAKEQSQGKEIAVKTAAEKFSNLLKNKDPRMKDPKVLQQNYDELVTALSNKEEKSKEDLDMITSLEKMGKIGMEKLSAMTSGSIQGVINNLQKMMGK